MAGPMSVPALPLSVVVDREIDRLLRATPGVTAVVGQSIVQGAGFPQGTTIPALRFAMESSAYDAGQLAGAEHLTAAQMRYVVEIHDAGTSKGQIIPAYMAQREALAGLVLDTDDGFQLTFTAQGEVPLTSYLDGAQVYQRLGDYYTVTVTHGGA